ncbi:MAG TPA: SCO family protein [Croceibacterium sp.]|jgi:protein SCO1/2
MNPAVMYRKFVASLLPLLLVACSSSPKTSAGSGETPPLAGATIGGPFTLTDSNGKTVHWSDFDGKYRIVYFGYTYCPDVCPLDMQHLMQGFALYKQKHPALAAQIVPMFISVDPERDTPKVVGEFTHAFSDDLLGLTGTPDEIAKAAKEFAIYYQKGKVNSQGGYLVNHSTQAYLMGRKGQPIALIPVDKDPPAVAEALEKWVS